MEDLQSAEQFIQQYVDAHTTAEEKDPALAWFFYPMVPPPVRTADHWADENRRLSSEGSAEATKWNTDRAPYQREVLQVMSKVEYPFVVWMSSTQVGKTELLVNLVGHQIDDDPCPILLIEPTIEIAKAWANERFDSMIRESDSLRRKVRVLGVDRSERLDAQSRGQALHRQFTGGHITVAGSNSVAGLASRPIRFFLGDDVDRWAPSAGDEGDQVILGMKRTTTFWNRKTILLSTPAMKATSRIWLYWLQSDQRQFHIPCPHCAQKQVLKWDRFKWDVDGEGDLKLGSVRYNCEWCLKDFNDEYKSALLAAGEWKPLKPGRRIVGFHIWEAYSPWKTWDELVETYLQAKRSGPEALKAFVNTSLGWPYENPADAPDWQVLLDRSEAYEPWLLPDKVEMLTAGVDVQEDRLEVDVWGWGPWEEAWHVGHASIYGNTAQQMVWDSLDTLLYTPVKQPGRERALNLQSVCIDSGHRTQQVYKYARARSGLVHATKGSSVFTAPPIARPTKRDVGRKGTALRRSVKLWNLGVHVLKTTMYERLSISSAGPFHLHLMRHVGKEWFQQLTAERLETEYKRGVKKQTWVQVRDRNEALDCMVLAYAAALIAGIERMPWTVITGESRPAVKMVDDLTPQVMIDMTKGEANVPALKTQTGPSVPVVSAPPPAQTAPELDERDRELVLVSKPEAPVDVLPQQNQYPQRRRMSAINIRSRPAGHSSAPA